MDLVSALQQENVTTENGMVTNSSSLSDCLDLFFKIGAFRAADESDIVRQFSLAFNQSPLTAMKILFWSRDVRGGAGERRVFRICIKYLASNHPTSLIKNIELISTYGRWDDVLELLGTKVESSALDIIEQALRGGNMLCAKWMPRKGSAANVIRKKLGLTPKEYRKLLVKNTQVVENKMCAKEWSLIDYSGIPSVAAARYQKAFLKSDLERYTQYIHLLKNPPADPEKRVKINASAVYPYDVVKSLQRGIEDVANEQWKALPNYLKDSNEMILPVVDVSGSMLSPVSQKGTLTCMEVSISLGLYISERNEGAFKDSFITFSERPKLQKLKGSLLERYNQLQNSEWGMTTDLESVFNTILNQARLHQIDEKEMPKKILIISDMEFNQAINEERSLSAIGMIREKYEENGYQMPSVIFWNVQSRGNNVPVRFDETGTALISGFSPSIMTSILGGKSIDPNSIMFDTINLPRYKEVSI
jgi:hypothetical protein